MSDTASLASLLQLVIAGCDGDISWAEPVAAAGVSTVLLQKCAGGRDEGKEEHKNYRWNDASPVPNATPPAWLRTLAVRPNRGREAHSYLWWIVHDYDNLRLRPVTLFLQDDAPRHVHFLSVLAAEPANSTRLRNNISEIAKTRSFAAFTSAKGRAKILPSTFKSNRRHDTTQSISSQYSYDVRWRDDTCHDEAACSASAPSLLSRWRSSPFSFFPPFPPAIVHSTPGGERVSHLGQSIPSFNDVPSESL